MENFNKAVGWGEDKQEYADFCLAAANDENLFKNFKQNPKYTKILEHVSPALGQQYYDLLTDRIKELIPTAHRVNDICNPILMETPEGLVSPTTLRYLKVIQDLYQTDWKVSTIVEIGGGYGGLAKIMQEFHPFNYSEEEDNYVIYDLAGPAALQNKYVYDGRSFEARNFQDIKDEKFDLVISNYAFSELDREIQDIYLEKVILPAKHGYLTYNPGALWEYTYTELFEILKDKNFKIRADHPMVENGYPQNKIITW